MLSQSSPITGRTTTNNGTVYVGAALRFVQKNPIADHDIVEIGLERTGCYGTCPAYTFVITADGKCNYEGGKYAKIQGKKTGRTRVDIFNRLATLVKEMGVFELQDEYTAAIYDVPSAYFTAATKEKRKTIRDHAGLAPVQLWAVEQLMDKILEEVKWEDASP